MRCLTKVRLKVRTSQGIIELEPGQEVEVPEEMAIRLIHERRISALEEISPLGEGASCLIYSEILKDFLWAVPDEAVRKKLIAEGVKEAIYTEAEIDLLRETSKETLKIVHETKKALPGSTVTLEGVKKG